MFGRLARGALITIGVGLIALPAFANTWESPLMEADAPESTDGKDRVTKVCFDPPSGWRFTGRATGVVDRMTNNSGQQPQSRVEVRWEGNNRVCGLAVAHPHDGAVYHAHVIGHVMAEVVPNY